MDNSNNNNNNKEIDSSRKPQIKKKKKRSEGKKKGERDKVASRRSERGRTGEDLLESARSRRFSPSSSPSAACTPANPLFFSSVGLCSHRALLRAL